MGWNLSNPPAQNIIVPDTKIVVTVRYDGRVELAPGADVDDAARRFWEAVEQIGRLRAGDGQRMDRLEMIARNSPCNGLSGDGKRVTTLTLKIPADGTRRTVREVLDALPVDV